jgi:putative sterol carrier protein
LGRWGAPLLEERHGKDAFCDHWIALPLRLYVRDHTPDAARVTLALEAGEEKAVMETVGDGSIEVRSGLAAHPDARIAGTPQQILRLLTGKMRLAEARAQGLRYEGESGLLHRFSGK